MPEFDWFERWGKKPLIGGPEDDERFDWSIIITVRFVDSVVGF